MTPETLISTAETILPQQTVLRARGCAAELLLSQSPWIEDPKIQRALSDWMAGKGIWGSVRDRWRKLAKATQDPNVKLAGELAREKTSALDALKSVYYAQEAPLLYARCLDAAWRADADTRFAFQVMLPWRLSLAINTTNTQEYLSRIIIPMMSMIDDTQEVRAILSSAAVMIDKTNEKTRTTEALRLVSMVGFNLAGGNVDLVFSLLFNVIYEKRRTDPWIVWQWTEILRSIPMRDQLELTRRLGDEPNIERAIVRLTTGARANPRRHRSARR